MNRHVALLVVLGLGITACKRAEQAATSRANTDSVRADSAHADSVRRLTPQPQPDPVITESQPRLVAHGLKGGRAWTVEVFNQGIRYKWPEGPAGVVFGAGLMEGDDSVNTWSAKRTGAGPKAIRMQLIKLPCRDGATDTVYAYRAALIVDTTRGLGCAAVR